MNVLFITADQWRGDCLSAVGHPCVRTPHLDALAADGVLFSNHYSQATPCGPSRASLHTGMYAMNHRSVTNGTPLDGRHTNLAAELRRGGFRPALFGHADMSPDPRHLPPDDSRLATYAGVYPDFDVALDLPEHQRAWLRHLERRGYRLSGLKEIHGRDLGEPAPFRAEDSETAFLTDRFLEFLDHRDDDPWCAHLSYIKPHPPFVAAAPYHNLIDADATPAAVRAATVEAEAAQHPWLAAHLGRRGKGWSAKKVGHGAELDAATVATLRAVYYGLICELDHHVGRIIDALRGSGILDDTLVIVTSDHGEMLGDHWMLDKAGYFRQAFHVPLIIRDPRKQEGRGRMVTRFSEHVDLMPTILDWLGRQAPRQCDGHSLMPLVHGGEPEGWRNAAHFEHDFRNVTKPRYEKKLGLSADRCGLAVRHGHSSSYVHFTGLPALYFDLRDDPDQLCDLAGEAPRASEVLAAAQAMLSWRMEHAERRLTGCKLTGKGVVGAY